MKREICKIHSLDSVWTMCNKEAADNLRNMMSYEYTLYIPGRFGKKKKMVKKYLIEGRGNGEFYFLTGYVDRCLNYLEGHNIAYEYESDIMEVPYNDPGIPGIEFREYQLDLINRALEVGRGVLKSPTGSGKSIIILGIMSAFSQESILFLVHTTDLVYQMKEDLVKFGFDDIGVWSGEDKFIGRITVSTVQSYKKIAREYTGHWDVVFVDEGHHISQVDKGNYFDALALTGASCKFATTATMPDKDEGRWALEGLIGPIIGEITMKEGSALGFLSVPNIIMFELESPYEVWPMKSYAKVYTEGISKNTVRNIRIAAEAEARMKIGQTVLILVSRIDHADRLEDLIDFKTEIVKGAVSKDERVRIKEELKSGTLKCVIATTAWIEGVDLPNLNCVINAAAGKSEIQTLQKIGRGLRKTDIKNSVDIIDFIDIGNKFLENHSDHRMAIYKEQGWSVTIK